jgi:hypothetical protein
MLRRLESKPGKEAEVEKFLRSGLAIVQGEPGTTVWFAIRPGAIDLRNLRRLPR